MKTPHSLVFLGGILVIIGATLPISTSGIVTDLKVSDLQTGLAWGIAALGVWALVASSLSRGRLEIAGIGTLLLLSPWIIRILLEIDLHATKWLPDFSFDFGQGAYVVWAGGALILASTWVADPARGKPSE